MAWRFKASKFKNAAFKFPKREELISELPVSGLSQSFGKPVSGLSQSFGNHIKASCSYVVFNTDTGAGGNLGYLPLNTTGKQTKSNIPLIQAHSDFVTDFDFSPFDDYLLATCSQDSSIKIWLLPEEGSENITSPELTLPVQDRKIENVLWHSTADGILAASTHHCVKIFDIKEEKEAYVLEGHGDVVQSISWHGYGKYLVSSCKDKKLRVFDPRTKNAVQEGAGYPNIKETRVMWLGNRDQILTSGFDSKWQRTIRLYDSRNLQTIVETKNYVSSTGVLIPLYDNDTGMLFLASKGDGTIKYLEVNEKDPYLVENNADRTEQIKGITMVPKRSVDVMQGEVCKLMILSQNAIIPTPVIIPRKSYRDFHDDLFPDTSTGEPSLTGEQWLQGEDKLLSLMSLNPSKRPKLPNRRGNVFSSTPLISSIPNQDNIPSNNTVSSNSTPSQNDTPVSNGTVSSSKESSPEKPVISSKKPELISDKSNTAQELSTNQSQANQCVIKEKEPVKPVKPTKTFSGVRKTKYRHLKAAILHRSEHIENIRNMDRTVPGESDFFHANNIRCVVPIEGGGGLLSIIELKNKGKLQDSGLPYLQHGSKVTDYAWDPFDDSKLVVCCDDAKIHVWRIPDEGLTETLTEAEMYLRGHREKIYFVKFHPMAKDLLVTASYDLSVKFWDLSTGDEIMEITDHPDQVFCCEWSPDGKLLATVCKDGLIRIYEPRTSLKAIKSNTGPSGSRGARVGWALDGKYLYTSGFDKMSNREIILYKSEDLSQISNVTRDTSPSILVPFYDEDSSTLFLTGRGDRQILAYEVATDDPHLFQLATTQLSAIHQAISFLSKNQCNVADVEFARAWRLTKTSIEPIVFTVPRVKKEFFQDDLFPDTKITWEPVLSCSEWLQGQDGVQKKINLQPDDMETLSEQPVLGTKPQKYESFNAETYKSDDQKKEELLSAMTNKLTLHEDPLPQDLTEGVDEDEWDDY